MISSSRTFEIRVLTAFNTVQQQTQLSDTAFNLSIILLLSTKKFYC